MDAPQKADSARTQQHRSRKWAKRGLIAILVYMIYPITVTLALSTGLVERMLASEDLKVEISAPTWSLLPGDVHMGRVKVFMNGETQFILSADNITAQIRLLPLLRRRFEIASLSATDIIYQMRVQVEESETRSMRVDAFPPLPGLPGVETRSKEVAEQTEERDPEWTVRLDGIDVTVQELWFFEYRYVGRGRLKGGFERGPQMMRVDTSVQDLGPGSLRFGAEKVISKNFQGKIEASIPELNPSEHADTSFFESVIAKIHLFGDIETLEHVSAYIPARIDVLGGAGPLDIRINMERGLLAPETRISYTTPDVGLKGNGFGVKTDIDLLIAMEPKDTPRPHLKSTSKITYLSLSSAGKDAFTIQIPGHEESATLNSARISAETEVESARIHMPKIETNDFDDLGGLLAKGDGLKTESGHASASLTLDLDEEKRLSGPLHARLNDASLGLDKVRARVDGEAKLMLSLDPVRDRGSISDFSIGLKRASFQTGDERVDDWWINFRSKRIDIAGLPSDSVHGDISIAARDAEPVIRVLAEDGKVPGIVADIVKLRNLKILAKVRKSQRTTDIMLDTLESKLVDFSGRIFESPKQSRLALLIGGKTISLGISRHDGRTGFQAFAGTDWLNERLAEFPKPRERVSGEKP